MPGPIRRVITTHDATGKAVIHSDAPAANVRVRPSSGIVSTLVWTTESSPARYSDEDRADAALGTAPPPGGSVLRVVEFPPLASTPAVDAQTVMSEMGIAHAPAGGRRPPRDPFMHYTESVDYAIVLEGEIDLVLDEDEVHLRAGEIVVQQGTNHSWLNRGTQPCRIAFVLLDAHPRP